MKTRDIEDRFRNMGNEKATVYILQALNEELLSQKKQIAELVGMQDKIITSLMNVVEGASGMKAHMDKVLREKGLVEAEAPELGPSTQGIE